jgi:hypothetical protein
MAKRRFTFLCWSGYAVAVVLASGCGAADPSQAAAASRTGALCLPGAEGFLRARLRGALNADLDWKDAQIRCEGGSRPDGAGVRVSIAGPLPDAAGSDAGRTLRFVFGIDADAGMTHGTALATNITAIVESGNGSATRVFATRGDDKCTTDRLQRQGTGSGTNEFRVEARGFCLGPASTLDGTERLLVTTFDFAGRVTLESP